MELKGEQNRSGSWENREVEGTVARLRRGVGPFFEEDTGVAQSRQITSKARSLEPCLQSGAGGGPASSLHPHPPHPSFLRCLLHSAVENSRWRSAAREERSREGGDKGALKGERSAMRGNRGPRLPESNRRCLFLESIAPFVAA